MLNHQFFYSFFGLVVLQWAVSENTHSLGRGRDMGSLPKSSNLVPTPAGPRYGLQLITGEQQ